MTEGKSEKREPSEKISPPKSQAPAGKTPKLGRHHIAAILLIVVTLLSYWGILENGFINFDDNIYITENYHVQKGLTLDGIEWAFITGHATNWHPLTWISIMLDYQVFGLNPTGHHLMALLLHVANTVLLFLVLRRMTGSLWRSAFVAALFALHPLHVESVAWAAERKDLLSTFFWVLTMWAYVRYVEKPAVVRYGFVLLLFALGLMAKPMLVTLPFVLLLLDYWPLGRYKMNEPARKQPVQGGATKSSIKSRFYRLFLEKLPMFALVVASSVITFMVQQQGGAVSSWEGLPTTARVANALVSYWKYIVKMFWPTNLAIFYPYPMSLYPAWEVIGAGSLLTAVTVVAILMYRKRPYLSVGWLWYLGTLIPVIGLVQVGAQSMADRYTYVPLIGLFIVIAWILPDLLAGWSARKFALAAGAGAALLALTVQTWSQVSTWRNSVTLFEHALQATSNNWLAHDFLGFALAAQGNYAEAEPHYLEALRLRPSLEEVHHGLGIALARQGKRGEAISHYREAIRIKPDYAGAHYDLAISLAEQGKTDEAIAQYTDALRIRTDYAEAHNNLGMLLATQGKLDESLVHFNEALRIRPDFADAQNNLGILLVKLGKTSEAIAHFNEALRINPDNADAGKNLDLALSTQPPSRGPFADTSTTPTQKPLIAESQEKKDTTHTAPPQQSGSTSQPASEAQKTETPQQKAETSSAPPDSAVIEFEKGLALYNERKLSEAMPYFKKALRLKPGYWEAAYNLGVIYHNQGNLKEAIDHYSKAIRVNPDYPEAQYNLGVAFHGQGDIDKAIARYRVAIRLKPDYAQAYNNLGVAYYTQKKYKEAIQQYEKALKLRPDYEEARRNLQVAKTADQGQNIILTPEPKKQ